MSVEKLDDAVRAVAQFLVADVPLGETLQRIACLARDGLAPVATIGITLLDEQERPTTAVATDEVAPAVDQGQYDEGDGPCLTAYRDARVVHVEDVRSVEDRWPRFCDVALRHGVHSTLSFPLEAGGEAFGAMNLYALKPGSFGESDEADAALFATQAGVVLANARAYWAAAELASGLQQAMASRAVIEQAKGKIMAINGCTPEAAFEMLVRASQRENVKLREVARRIVEGHGERPPSLPSRD